ncbi:MAG TPA: dTDP-4-dehydrorhamnose 3,5-epimerase [Candidatus Dojkabacteria bacterium]|jgi:dTDP-4-dehydrorhamnose 3,5-epimerase
MKFTETKFEGLKIIEPNIFGDDRGFFLESYSKKEFEENGINADFVQDNHSRSSSKVLRGLHFQKPPFDQGKLIRVTIGAVLDVVVDLRKNSKTFGEYFSLELSEHNKKILWIPRGFAHGFLVLSETADFQYKVDNYYNKESEGGIIWDDMILGIKWGISDPKVSEKDSFLPQFKDFESPF